MIQAPSVTVVVPAYNEQRWIEQCLRALQNQDYPAHRYQVLVIDNRSTDETAQLARACGITVLTEPKHSAFCARNRAIQASTSDWLAFIDSDCIAQPGWLSALMHGCQQQGLDLAGGNTQYQLAEDNIGNRALRYRYRPEIRQLSIEQHKSVPTGNMLAKRQLFTKLGLFTTLEAGGDTEFSQRVAKAGYKVGYVAAAIIGHQCDFTALSYLRRSYWLAAGKEMHQAQPTTWQRLAKRAPWRPGLGAGQRAATAMGYQSKTEHAAVWAYLWADRSASWLGTLSGRLQHSKDKS